GWPAGHDPVRAADAAAPRLPAAASRHATASPAARVHVLARLLGGAVADQPASRAPPAPPGPARGRPLPGDGGTDPLVAGRTAGRPRRRPLPGPRGCRPAG